MSDRRIPDEGTIFQVLGMQKQEWRLIAGFLREGVSLRAREVAGTPTFDAIQKLLQRVEGMR